MAIDYEALHPEQRPPRQLQDPVAVSTVQGVIAAAQSFSASLAQQALDALDAPSGTTINVDATIPDIVWPNPNPSLYEAPVPSIPAPSFPAAPVEPSVTPVGPLEIAAEPALSAVKPTLATIDLPDPLEAVAPELGPVGDVVIPEAPDPVLPEVPTLMALNLPPPPIIELPIFDDVVMDRPVAPDVTFAWSEANYASELHTAMNNRLITFVNGASTGLTADVEQAIWARGRARENANSMRAFDEVRRSVAGRGFIVPPGAMQIALQRAATETIEKDSSISRDVMIKQAELEQSNFQFAFTTALGLESKMIDYCNQMVQRSYDAAKYALQVVIELFNAKTQLYVADAQVFQAKASVFKVRLEAALAALEVYKAELEGQKLIGDLNLQQTQIYKVRLEGVLAAVEIYKAQVAAAQAQAEVNKNVIEGYRARVQAFGEVVRAKAVEYEGYATQVKAQATQAEIYASEVASYKSQADAYASFMNARIASKTFEVKVNQEIPLQIFERRVNAYQASVNAEAARIKSYVDTYATEVTGWAAGVDGSAKMLGAQASMAQAQASAAAAMAQVAVAQIRVAADQAIANAEISSANIRAQGQVAGMLAAAAMSQVNVGANMGTSHSTSDGIQSSDSYSVGDGFSRSISTNVNINRES